MTIPSMRRLGLLALAALAVGCAGTAPQPALRIDPKPRVAALQANFTQAQLQLIGQNCPLGRPTLDPEFDFGPTRFVIRQGYVLEHSSRDKIPIWVCEGITPAQLGGTAPRKDAFQPDPQLPPGLRAELKDYKGSGYDRGHMAPAGDQTVDPVLKRETFYLSNMSPQEGPLNQRIWAALEDQARAWLTQRGGGWIITGGLFYDPDEEDPTKADGFIPYQEIGPDRVAVPTHFYKIVVSKSQAGVWDAIAFVMENHGYPAPFNFSQFIRSIDWIEEHTGINFMPDLAVMDESRVEGSTPVLWTP